MRLLLLYARSRGAPAAAGAVTVIALTGWAAAQWLTTGARYDETARLPVAVAAALVTAVVLSATLVSAAGEIEAATPVPWPRWRLVHTTTAALTGGLLLAPVLPATAYGAGPLLRNLAGTFGLAMLAAACAGPRLAWTLPTGYVFTVYLADGTVSTGARQVWAFITQPTTSRAATATALALLALGAASWALTTRPTPDWRQSGPNKGL